MSKKSSPTHKIVFLGTPLFAATILKILAQSPFRPLGVITEPDRPVGRTQILTPPPVKVTALALNIPVSQPARHLELSETLRFWQADLMIVAAYGRILRPDVLELPKFGIVNVHPSLLPKYRGATPIQAAILAGDMETGVSLMLIEEGVDTGPILAQEHCAIDASDTSVTLSDKLAHLGSELLIKNLAAYLGGRLTPRPQPTGDESVTRLITKNHGRLTGNEMPEQIVRMLRAYTPWPGVWTEIDGQRLLLHAAHIDSGRLVPDRVQLAGKQPVDWATFQRGQPQLTEAFIHSLRSR